MRIVCEESPCRYMLLLQGDQGSSLSSTLVITTLLGLGSYIVIFDGADLALMVPGQGMQELGLQNPAPSCESNLSSSPLSRLRCIVQHTTLFRTFGFEKCHLWTFQE